MRGWPRRSRGPTHPPPPIDYDAVFRRTADNVYAVCLAVLRDPTDAQDAMMAVFEKLLSKPPKQVDTNLEGWLKTAARTTAIDHLRALRRTQPLDETFDLTDPAPTPEEVVLDDELRRSVREHFGTLTPDQRQVLDLRLAELSGNEIAALLGRTRGWVDVTAHRAIERLQRVASADPAGMEGAR